MPDASKITILLADDDALRREGLAAVLSQNDGFEIVAGVSDGEQALLAIRNLHPQVAVVDLNLPLVHGIELVRRVRGESLGTKVIVLASTSDDEIIREVVRAGADAYLLNNGPTRHLIDAVSYVRDGGQYFSPQLRRDGRDRHLFEEPARVPTEAPQLRPEEPQAREASDSPRGRGGRGRRPLRQAGDISSFRDRIREEVSGPEMADRDYEIMSMMAEGIRPILDRLDEIDSRVSHMETGDEPVPANPKAWLSTQLAGSVGRRGGELVDSRAGTDLEASLPAMIEDAVAKRFQQMAGKLQDDIEETHVRTLETFVKNVQVKLVQRVSALEQDMSTQAQAMTQLQEYSLRTEDNLSRLISGVDRLAKELPTRLGVTPDAPASPQQPAVRSNALATGKQKRRNSARSGSAKKAGMAVAAVALLALAGWGAKRMFSPTEASSTVGTAVSGSASSEKPIAPREVPADTKSRLAAAKESADRKDYPNAENLFREVVKVEPANVEALQGLASVLYREDKIEEATAILDKLPKN